MNRVDNRPLAAALLALVGASGTLVCCVLPAVMVALGAGSALTVLVATVPQLIWLSEHKSAVFGIAGAMLLLGALSVARSRSQPCPADPKLAAACNRLRRWSMVVLMVAAIGYGVGVLFAFVLPILMAGGSTEAPR